MSYYERYVSSTRPYKSTYASYHGLCSRGGGFGGYGGMHTSVRKSLFGGGAGSSKYRRRYQRRYLNPDSSFLDRIGCQEDDDDKPVTHKVENLLKATHVDLHLDENRAAHHTNEYELENLIVRRGQSFKLTVTFNREIKDSTDSITLQFVTGNRPKPSKETLIRVPKVKNLNTTEWGLKEVKRDGTSVTYEIMSKADAPVAPWQLFVITRYEQQTDQANTYRHKVPEEIYILFNSWCKDDTVYMDDEKERQEYVMNETGRIWIGSARRFSPRPWNYGQFEDVCLLAAMRCLELAELDGLTRGNSTLVARTLSQYANSCDNDDGILTGNWSGDYSGGTSPTDWCGSVAILEKYMKTKKEVKFGQCWVFSGLLTTLGRTLGIPTRSVTNFASAHDTDASCTIDNFYDVYGNPLDIVDDSIWNFHVWNESFFKRPDLPDGYDGWQAYDATPQETSEGVMRCGPASLIAIRKGDLYLCYDAKFIYAEVNGDVLNWEKEPDGEFVLINTQTSAVGKFISTKSVGNTGRNDITDLYKCKEGSAEERSANEKAKKLGSRRDYLAGPEKEKEVSVDFEFNVSRAADIISVVKCQNNGKDIRTFYIKNTAVASNYNGHAGDKIKEDGVELEVQPGQSSTHEMLISACDYLNRLDCDGLVKIYSKVKVKESGDHYAASEICAIDKPDLVLEVTDATPKVGHTFDVKVTLANPLAIPLTGGEIRIEGPGVQKSLSIPLKKSIPPGGEIKEVIPLKPRFSGKREIIACLNTRQLVGINGTIMVDVQKAN